MQGCSEQDCRSVGRKDANVDRGAQTADVKKTAQVRATFIQPLSTTSNWNARMKQEATQPEQTPATTNRTSQLKEDEQQKAQSTTGKEQRDDDQRAVITAKLQQLEHLLVKQIGKGNALENALAAAQDKIGGVERRAQQLECENAQLRGELQCWNNQYVYGNGISVQQERQTDGRSPLVYSCPVNTVTMPQVSPMPISSICTVQKMASSPLFTTPVLKMPSLSSPLVGAKTAIIAPPLGSFINCENERSEVGITKTECTNLGFDESWKNMQNRAACMYEGKTGKDFCPLSSMVQQNTVCGQNDGRTGSRNYAEPSQQQTRATSPLFKFKLKPKEPPVYCGTTEEDIDTWLTKVFDYISLTEANDQQQVAYMATLLQDASGRLVGCIDEGEKGLPSCGLFRDGCSTAEEVWECQPS